MIEFEFCLLEEGLTQDLDEEENHELLVSVDTGPVPDGRLAAFLQHILSLL